MQSSLQWAAAALLMLALTTSGHTQDGDVVTSLQAWGGLDGSLHVRWTTAPPSRARVEYGPTADLGSVAEEDPDCLRGTTNNRDAGTGWANNHRADIPRVEGWPAHLRLSGQTREGLAFTTPVQVVNAPARPVGRAERGRVPVRIHAGGWKLPRLPVTVGVPFPPGELADAEHVRLLIGDEPVTCQARVVTRWHRDSTVKWLRVDFMAPAGADEAVLEYGTGVPVTEYEPPPDVRQAVSLPDPLCVLVDAAGKEYPGRVESSVVEEAGPIKSVLRLRGSHVAEDGSRLCGFSLRCHVWWGPVGVLRNEFTFENDNTGAEFTAIRSLEMVGRPGQWTSMEVGLGDERITLADGQRVLQREDSEWVAEPGGEKGRRLEGVVRLGEAEAVIPNFWQSWPISVGLGDGAEVVGLLPALPEGFYADRPDEDKLYYQIRDGLHTLRQGFTRTWDIWITPAGDTPRLVGEHPCASVPPEWSEASGALRGLAVAARDQFTGYDEALAQGVDRYLEARDRAREYGMMNFGDWHGERTWNWGNLEYDLGHGFLTQFARTGKPEFFWRAEECVRHERDVDTRHYADDPRRVGQQWTHSIGHTAGYYPPEYKDMKVYASPGWSDNRGHIWSQGMFEHYLLGGDRRSWEVATLISDWAAGPQTTNFIFGNAREPGWMTKLVMGAYLATEDPFYLNAARIMLDKVHEQSLATGDHGFYYHKLPNGHCDCPEDQKHYGEAGFMLGVLMTGMKMFYEATGDERVADDIVKTARFIVQTMWVPEQLGFRYTSCPRTGASAASAWIMMEGLAFAAARSGDEALADVCRRSLAAGWGNLPTTGKSAGYIICSSAQALQEFSRVPGPSFPEYRAVIERALRSPARRPLPTNVPNPDFETDTLGWPSRGWALERSAEAKHSGGWSLKISGKVARQNEYINTTYDSTGSPYEINYLRPGVTYRLTAWLRVDSITPGAPAPSMRVQFRDAGGSKASKGTNAYDLGKMGTWQKLTVDAQIPDYNTRNYLALNTNSRDEIEVVMYFDDVSLVPLSLAGAEQYAHYRLDPAAAKLSGGAGVETSAQLPGEDRLRGPGEASWQVAVEHPGRYVLWLRADAGSAPGSVAVNGATLPAPAAPEEPAWLRLGEVELAAGEASVRLSLPPAPGIGRLVLTNDVSSAL